MPKKTIQRFLPDHRKIKENKSLSIFGDLLHDSNLWLLNRRSARGAFAVGIFFALIPVPFQMVLAAAFAILFKVNLPISVALVWITNPFTMPAIFYGTYVVGTWVLGTPVETFAFEPSFEWLMSSLSSIGPPFLLGCVICAACFSFVAFLTIDYLWRLSVKKAWNNRGS